MSQLNFFLLILASLSCLSASLPDSDELSGTEREIRTPRRVCPDGTDKSVKEPKCFMYVSEQKSFVDAENYCQSQLGHLAAVRNGFDNHLLADHGREKFKGQMVYLGASVINSESNTWRWFDESQLKFTNWLTPVTAVEVQYNQCVAMNPLNRGKWMTVDCFRKLFFVCEVPMIQ